MSNCANKETLVYPYRSCQYAQHAPSPGEVAAASLLVTGWTVDCNVGGDKLKYARNTCQYIVG